MFWRSVRSRTTVNRRAWAITRYFRIHILVMTCLATVLGCLLLPHDPVRVPGRLDVYAVVTNTLPLLPALSCGACLSRFGPRETHSPRGRSYLPVLLALICSAALGITSVLAHWSGVPTFTRNLILLLTVLGLISWALTYLVGAVSISVYVMICWLWGVDAFGQVMAWAPLMAEPRQGRAETAVTITCVALVCVLLRYGRRVRLRPSHA